MVDGSVATVRTAAGQVTGRLMAASRVGSGCLVMVRPEAVAITPASSGIGCNSVGVEVISHVIAGAIARTHLRCSDGTELVATQLTQRAGRTPSGTVSACFSPEDTLVFGEGA